VREDGPTLPRLSSFASGVSGEGEEAGGTPTWPIDRGHSHPAPTNLLMPLMLGASLILNVVLLIGLVSILVLGHSVGLSQGNSPAGSSSPVPTVSILSTASPRVGSPTITSSPATAAGWLQVTPTSMQLGCNSNQQTQFVVLKNSGTLPVQWQVSFSLPPNQVGINVSPNQGTLDSGSSMPIQLQNQTHATGPQGVPGQQGTIEFNPATPNAGSSPSLVYSTVGCK
jgi:hypothetical protein